MSTVDLFSYQPSPAAKAADEAPKAPDVVAAEPAPVAADAEPVAATVGAAQPVPPAALAGKRLCLVDGSGFIFRAYHSLPPLTRADGTPVGAVMGFTNMLLKLMENHVADYFAVIFDAGRHTFRNRMYEAYKANRPPAPEDLIPQFPLVREATRAFNVPALEVADYEADDLIATYTAHARAAGMEVVIVSSDKDLMQLVADGEVWLHDAMKGRDIRSPEVLEKFGVPPERVGDVLALMGDSSDNIPGVPGIGPKTAAELIVQFGDLESLLARAGEIKQPKRREALQENAEKARLSRQLVALCCDVPLPMPLEALILHPVDHSNLLEFARQMGFRALITRLQSKGVTNDTPASPAATKPIEASAAAPATSAPIAPSASRVDRSNYQLVQSVDQLHALMKRATAQGVLAIDTETTGLDAQRVDLVGVSLALGAGEAYYVPLAHVDDFGMPLEGQIPREGALAVLAPVLADPATLKIGHNIKYDIAVLRRAGLELRSIADTMVMSYTLNAGTHAHNMDFLAERYLNHITISFADVTGSGRSKKTFAQVPFAEALAYAAEDADVTWQLYHLFWPQLVEQKLLQVYELDMRNLPILSAMEARGITVDRAALADLTQLLATKANALEQEIFAIAGHPFTIGSPKQLGDVLFGEMGLEGGRKNAKTGQYSTDAQLLEELADAGHALPAKVLEWRQATKLMNTYTESLPEQINPTTGRVHTSFNITGAATGRLSSSDPNLQNIPIRTEEGRRIRHAFVAAPGHVLLSADYSQIELRLLAHVADIAPLKDAFRHGRDIHAATAAQMFGVPLEQVNSDLRRKAKTINFGIIYGISAHGLATRLGISRAEAADYIAQYFEQYPGIKAYMDARKDEARTHGYVTTLFGRRIHIAGIHEKNGMRRAFAERQAINAPLQGSAADIIKRAMIGLQPVLAPHAAQAQLLLQVHDELVLEVTEPLAATLAPRIQHTMEHAAHLSIPLTVEVGQGRNWGDAH